MTQSSKLFVKIKILGRLS